jgi:hypothetical protein
VGTLAPPDELLETEIFELKTELPPSFFPVDEHPDSGFGLLTTNGGYEARRHHE